MPCLVRCHGLPVHAVANSRVCTPLSPDVGADVSLDDCHVIEASRHADIAREIV
jgi:hypothetical protein